MFVSLNRIINAAKNMNDVLNLTPQISYDGKKRAVIIRQIVEAAPLIQKEDLVQIDKGNDTLSFATQCTLFDLGIWMPNPNKWNPYERKHIPHVVIRKLITKEEKHSTMTRPEAFAKAVRYGGTKSEIILRTEAMYSYFSGKLSNMKTCNVFFEWVMPTLVSFGIMKKDPDTKVYSVIDGAPISPLFDVPEEISNKEDRMIELSKDMKPKKVKKYGKSNLGKNYD